MARQRNPNRDQAKRSYIESGGTISTKELAAAAGVPENRIRKWKSEDKWKDALEKKKRGGQRGNKNAVGHGAPPYNTNAVTHGAYKTIYFEELSPQEQELIQSLTLETQENMLRELQTLVAKENDLKKRIRKLEETDPAALFVDKVIEMLVPKGNERLKNQEKKLEELIIERDNLVWEIENSGKPSKTLEKKLDKCERQIVELQDKVNDNKSENEGNNEPLKTAMQTIIKASPFDRAIKLEQELNKVHGRIIRLLDSIKSYELDSRRIELEEKKYRLAKQKLTGAYEIDPETGEIDDTKDDEEGEITL
jgi:ArsR family metal-binding transcriptional regulator